MHKGKWEIIGKKLITFMCVRIRSTEVLHVEDPARLVLFF